MRRFSDFRIGHPRKEFQKNGELSAETALDAVTFGTDFLPPTDGHTEEA